MDSIAPHLFQINPLPLLEDPPMPDPSPLPGQLIELARASAIRRNHREELERQEAVIRGAELERLQDLFIVRGLLEKYGLVRVENWVANMAKELGL